MVQWPASLCHQMISQWRKIAYAFTCLFIHAQQKKPVLMCLPKLRPHLWWSFFSNFFFLFRSISDWIDFSFFLLWHVCCYVHCTIDSRLPNGDEVLSYVSNADCLTIEIFVILLHNQLDRLLKLPGFICIIKHWHSFEIYSVYFTASKALCKRGEEKSSKSICEIRRRQIENCFTSISHISPPWSVCVCKSHMVNAIAFMLFAFLTSPQRCFRVHMWKIE